MLPKACVAVFFCFASSLWAVPEAALEQLSMQEHRPSVEEFLKAFESQIPDAWEWEVHPTIGGDILTFEAKFVDLIVELEKLFPHGRWAFLGRDMVDVALGIEAFYLLNGDSGRVVYLNASKNHKIDART